ncbi:hypothetical protein GQ457_05G019830 [Hibiscus cannabinus]
MDEDYQSFLSEIREDLKVLFDSYFSDRTLLVIIHHAIWPITQEALHRVFAPYGSVEKIVPFQKSSGVQFLIKYQGYGAMAAINSLQGRNIYDGCCQLDIQLYTDTTTDFAEPVVQVSTMEASTVVEFSDSLLAPPLVRGVCVVSTEWAAMEHEQLLTDSKELKVFDELPVITYVESDGVQDMGLLENDPNMGLLECPQDKTIIFKECGDLTRGPMEQLQIQGEFLDSFMMARDLDAKATQAFDERYVRKGKDQTAVKSIFKFVENDDPYMFRPPFMGQKLLQANKCSMWYEVVEVYDPYIFRLLLMGSNNVVVDRLNLAIHGINNTEYLERIINSDGNKLGMCGNRILCLARYIVECEKLAAHIYSVKAVQHHRWLSSNKETDVSWSRFSQSVVEQVTKEQLCLKVLETFSRSVDEFDGISVTITSQAITTLKMLRENKKNSDLVISNVHMPDMDGFKLLELLGFEMDLPVIMLSANGDTKLVMKGITHGVGDYLLKHVQIEKQKNIWKHVVRRKKFDKKDRSNSDSQDKPHADSGEVVEIRKADNNVKINKKRNDYNEDEDEDLDQLQNNKGIRHIGELLTANSTVVFPVSGSLIDSRIAGFSNNSLLSVTSNSLMLERSSQQANLHASNLRDWVSAVGFQNGNTLSNFASIDLVSGQLRDSKADLQGQAAPVNCNAGPMIRSVAQEWNAPRKDAPYQSHFMSSSVNYFNPVHGIYSDPVQYSNTVGLNSRPVRMLNYHLIQNMPFTFEKDRLDEPMRMLFDPGGIKLVGVDMEELLLVHILFSIKAKKTWGHIWSNHRKKEGLVLILEDKDYFE